MGCVRGFCPGIVRKFCHVVQVLTAFIPYFEDTIGTFASVTGSKITNRSIFTSYSVIISYCLNAIVSSVVVHCFVSSHIVFDFVDVATDG